MSEWGIVKYLPISDEQRLKVWYFLHPDWLDLLMARASLRWRPLRQWYAFWGLWRDEKRRYSFRAALRLARRYR